MDAREFINIQEAIAWVMSPIVVVWLALLLSTSVLYALYSLIAKTVRHLTRPRR